MSMHQLQKLSPDQFRVQMDALAEIWPNAEWSSRRTFSVAPLEFSIIEFFWLFQFRVRKWSRHQQMLHLHIRCLTNTILISLSHFL